MPAQQRDLRPQGKRTVALLMEAGIEVFGTLGYQSARVEDLVRAANTSHGTFYLYFANKEDLLHALAEECSDDMNRLAAKLGPVPEGPEGLAELRAWIGQFISTYERHAAVIRAWSEQQVQGPEMERLGERAFSQLTAQLVVRIREATGSRVKRAQTAAAALIGLLERVTYYRLSRALDFDEDEWLDTLAVFLHRGFFGGRQTPVKPRRRKRS